MKEFKYETIIISKEAWKFLNNFNRESKGFKALPDERLNAIWLRMRAHRVHNGGANPATHPVDENEIRIDRNSFDIKWDKVKQILASKNFEYRQDGYVAVGFNA